MLESIFTGSTLATISSQETLICIGISILIGIIISMTYKATTKASSNFLVTLALLPTLVHTVILLVNGNLGTSLAVAGAFGFIRFRSMQGTSKEIISIFWAMVMGLVIGMGYVLYGAIITVVIAILFILYSKISEKMLNKSADRKLKIVIPENLDYEEVFNDLLKEYTDSATLKKVKTTNMGSMYELVYTIRMKKDKKEKDFLDEIRVRNGNMLVMLQRYEVSEVEL